MGVLALAGALAVSYSRARIEASVLDAPANLDAVFGLASREVDGDWRDYMELLDGPPVKLRATVVEEHSKTILTFNSSPDIGFDRSINAYRGCEHGCIYCFARPTHAFHDLSPGLDFESKLFAKPDAARLLRAELALPRNASYRTYANLGRRYAVWNVFATPEFSMKPQQWCFVFAGCVNYRGYFDKAEADAFAAALSLAVAMAKFKPLPGYQVDRHANVIDGEYVGDRSELLRVEAAHGIALKSSAISIQDWPRPGEREVHLLGIYEPRFEELFREHPDFKAYWDAA